MAVRIVKLGSPRVKGEGTRIGTVRRPPRGVPKAEFAKRDIYDVWYPNLSPSPELMELGLAAETPAAWKKFVRGFRKEMATPENSRTLDVLAALSHQADFSVGCYCDSDEYCHRWVLRDLLEEKGAEFAN